MSDKEKIYYVYIDWTTENIPRPFYIGKGSLRRVGLTYRNKLHDNISKKYGVIRKIILETTDENIAFETEIRLISEYKTCVYDENYIWGANFTHGTGRLHTSETKEKLRRIAINQHKRAREQREKNDI